VRLTIAIVTVVRGESSRLFTSRLRFLLRYRVSNILFTRTSVGETAPDVRRLASRTWAYTPISLFHTDLSIETTRVALRRLIVWSAFDVRSIGWDAAEYEIPFVPLHEDAHPIFTLFGGSGTAALVVVQQQLAAMESAALAVVSGTSRRQRSDGSSDGGAAIGMRCDYWLWPLYYLYRITRGLMNRKRQKFSIVLGS
jgi:hypothetical protein